jgi:A/G-specific adenine glycosylase
VGTLTRWFDTHERPLPWRSTTPWGVMVSEFMLQQTPVDRVLPVWQQWLDRWPQPADLATASLADALRAWGRLGYPRRAQRLHQSAVAITRDHGGRVPDDPEALRALPGVGEYTAAAILAFAFGRRSIVLDTNVRRVLVRALAGEAGPPGHLTVGERALAESVWPDRHAAAARWSAAVMEFGALICTARQPSCDACPVARQCAWLAAGRPEAPEARRRQPAYEGSDRQARGELMRLLRERPAPALRRTLITAFPDAAQAERALASLVADGLVTKTGRGTYCLPSVDR